MRKTTALLAAFAAGVGLTTAGALGFTWVSGTESRREAADRDMQLAALMRMAENAARVRPSPTELTAAEEGAAPVPPAAAAAGAAAAPAQPAVAAKPPAAGVPRPAPVAPAAAPASNPAAPPAKPPPAKPPPARPAPAAATAAAATKPTPAPVVTAAPAVATSPTVPSSPAHGQVRPESQAAAARASSHASAPAQAHSASPQAPQAPAGNARSVGAAPAAVSLPLDGVTYEKAAVARLEAGAVVMRDGRRIALGQTFPSGETLVAVDAQNSRLVTDRRQIVLFGSSAGK